MADRDPMSAEESHQLSHQQGANKGKIKRPQQTDANMAEEDLPRAYLEQLVVSLREAGLVESSRRGTWAYYRLVPEAIAALRGALGA